MAFLASEQELAGKTVGHSDNMIALQGRGKRRQRAYLKLQIARSGSKGELRRGR